MGMLASLLVAVVLVILLGVVTLIRSTFDWKLWPAIRRARREIKKVARRRVPGAEVFSGQGATAINPGHLSFCIWTGTDKDRDLLRQDPEIHKEFRSALARAGYPTDTDPVVHFGIESQETVDRDYGGSWDEATRMP
jgi:hypothetical protein